MEIEQNWNLFQKFFYPRPSRSDAGAQLNAPAFLICHRGKVISAYSTSDSMSNWIGYPKDEVIAKLRYKNVFVFERSQVDQWLKSSVGLDNFYDQAQFFIHQADRSIHAKKADQNWIDRDAIVFKQNFLLKSFKTGLGSFMPSAFGVLIQMKGSESERIFLICRKGSLKVFNDPELKYIGSSDRNDLNQVVKYLSDKYLVPVQGMSVNRNHWEKWCGQVHPWKSIHRALWSGDLKLFPNRWRVRLAIYLKSLLGL